MKAYVAAPGLYFLSYLNTGEISMALFLFATKKPLGIESKTLLLFPSSPCIAPSSVVLSILSLLPSALVWFLCSCGSHSTYQSSARSSEQILLTIQSLSNTHIHKHILKSWNLDNKHILILALNLVKNKYIKLYWMCTCTSDPKSMLNYLKKYTYFEVLTVLDYWLLNFNCSVI